MIYRSFSEEMREMFGCKVYKLSLSSGCTCPNRDGTLGYGGCTFCSEGGSGEFAAPFRPVEEQILHAKALVDKKLSGTDHKYLAYFQSFTNTYGDTERLETLFLQALDRPEIVGLSVGTRPDCLEEEKVRMLARLNERKPVWVELGLQTIHEETARRIRRGYELAAFTDAMQRLKHAGLRTVVHLILYLPGETVEQMLESVRFVGNLHPDGVKLQLLQILKGTEMAEEYVACPERYHLPTLEEYCGTIVQALKALPEDTVIHRLTGDGPKRLLIAPLWCADKKKVINTLAKTIKNA